MMSDFNFRNRRFFRALKNWSKKLSNGMALRHINWLIERRAPQNNPQRPVVFFNASTRLGEFSQNAAFSRLASWALRLQGVPVVNFVCQSGMSHCVLGTSQSDFNQAMPCANCLSQSKSLYGAGAHWFSYQQDVALAAKLDNLPLSDLMSYEHPLPENWTGGAKILPLGALVLSAFRWRLRRHNLTDDAPTRYLYRQFILSAWNVACAFRELLEKNNPQAVVLYNGQFFPEAVARWVCLENEIRVITHEVGIQPLTGYFTPGESTAYPIHIPEEFTLSEAQNSKLDGYLASRMQGKFAMAGIQFWPHMRGLDGKFLQKAADFKQIVPVFTNVIFDTSQPHSNVLFSDMFAWLDSLLEVAQRHPDTLFVLRAHPDESRPGKSAEESVADWVAQTGADKLANLIFIPSEEFISSYELIQRSKFVLIYNSTIGLEASIVGTPVLCAGKARFTQYPTVFFPASQKAYQAKLEEFLSAASIEMPLAFRVNARRFLYYQLYYTSLPFDGFLSPGIDRSAVWLKNFSVKKLLPANSATMRVILEGILKKGDFLLSQKDID